MPSDMKLQYPHVAARVFNTPLLIDASKLHTILQVLGPRLGFDAPALEGEALDANTPQHEMAMKHLRAELTDDGYYLAEGGTAVLPILGSLVQRSSWMDAMSGMQSYAEIGRMFTAAMNDHRVSQIMLEMDTPGGEVAGAFDLADLIYNARGEKRVIAVASEKALSAGYLIASAADERVVPRTGHLGSIGVVAAHYDYSKAMEKRGVAITFVYAGAKKVDGHPYAPLPANVKAEWQAQIDEVYKMFVDTVSRNLGLSADKVRGTQAGVFMGFKAVEAGLADRVNTLANELSNSALRQQRGGSMMGSQGKETNMAGEKEKDKEGKPDAPEGDEKDKKEKKPSAEELSAARVEGVQQERARIKGILTHAEAEGRTTLAQHLAFETDTTVEAAGNLLKAASKEGKGSKLDKAMEHFRPNVPGQEITGDQKPTIDLNGIYASRQKAVEAARA